jgi:anaerobic magnesium-protoporphyrin IX monomethyl ester cyclase
MTPQTDKAAADFRVLIVYPNLPLMLVPSISIAIFTRIFRDLGYQIDLFETTHYDTNDLDYSETNINYSENRVRLLNARKFDVEKDLGISIKRGMLSDFRTKVETFDPDFIIYSVVEDTFFQARSMMQAIADLKIPHLVGGVFPTMAPEECIAAPEIDLIALGEGEKTVKAVGEAVRTGQPLNGIPGTWLKNPDGSIEKTQQPSLVNLNDIIPDFSLFHPSRFNRPMGGKVFRMVPVESYRGCPYACTYCNSPTQRLLSKNAGLGNFMRRKSMDSLRDKLRALYDEYKPDFFFFVDDSFLARPRQEIFDFCDMYEEFRLPFYFNTRAENCDAEILARLKEVGCYRIAFGIESGNQQYRQRVLRRKISNEEIIERFKVIADSGIAFSINLIIGMPGETRDLVMDTIELARSIKGYDAVTAFIFTPYHGTPLRQVALDNNWLDPNTITRHNTSRSLLTMPPPYLNADEIDGLLTVLPLYCYFPKTDWPKIRRAESNDAEGLRLRAELSAIYAENFLGEDQKRAKKFVQPDGTIAEKQQLSDFRISPERIQAADLKSLTDPMIGL